MGARVLTSFLDVDGLLIVCGRFLRVETDDRGKRIVCQHKRPSGEVQERRYLYSAEDFETGDVMPIVDQLELVEAGHFVAMGVRSFITKDKTGTYMRVHSIRVVDESAIVSGSLPQRDGALTGAESA